MLTVDPDGGADFTELQVAIDAAQDGDTLRLGAGIYNIGPPNAYQITNKDLRIIGETPQPTFWDGFVISDLDAGKVVILSNLDLSFERLTIEDCAGTVRIQEATAALDAKVIDSADVVFTRTVLLGHQGDEQGTPGDGLYVSGSNVAVFSCSLIGGDGDPQPAILSYPAADGGSGCRVVNGGFVYLADCSLEGGDGGNGHVADYLDPPVDGGDGGYGLTVFDGAAVVLDSTRVGGAAGAGGVCFVGFPNCGPPGADGVPGRGTLVEPGQSLEEIAGVARTAEVVTWVENTNEVVVTFHGQPGDLVFMLGQPTPDFLYDPVWRGVWAQPQSGGPQLGVIPGSGTLVETVQLPPVVTCSEATQYLQAAFIDTTPQPIERFIGTPVAMVSITPPADYPTTCSSNPNSTGEVAQIAGTGNPDAAAEDLLLSVDELPTNKIGYFLFSTNQIFVPLFGGSQGNLCVGQPLKRYLPPVLNSGATGSVELDVDFDNIPTGAVFEAGDTWYFQLWYRDNNPGTTSNTTEALVVSFCP